MKLRLFIYTSMVLLAACASKIRKDCGSMNKTIRKGSLESKYSTAMCYYQNEKYYQAGAIFESISADVIGSDSAQSVEFYAAMCNYYNKNLFFSAHYFRKFFRKYPRSPKAEEAHYMHVRSLYESSASSNLDQSSTWDAIHACQSFINKYPESKWLEECNKIIDELQAKLEKKAYDNAKLFLKVQRYKSAVIAFTNFPDQFPGSKYVEEITYLRVLAQFNLAEISAERVRVDGEYVQLKEKRYKETITYYQSFIDLYPKSEYAEEAQNLFRSARIKLQRLTGAQKI